MTSALRAETLIGEHFLDVWPLIAIGVPCAIAGPATPPASRDQAQRAGSFAHLTVEIERGARHGWVIVRLWVPLALQVTGSAALGDAAAHLFGGQRIPSDDGAIEIGEGERWIGGRDVGGHWMSAVQFPFRLV